MEQLKLTSFFTQRKNANDAAINVSESVAEEVPGTSSIAAQFYQACLGEQSSSCQSIECIRKKSLLKKKWMI